MARNGTVVGYFTSRTNAESAIQSLQNANFKRNHIGYAVRSGAGTSGTTLRTETAGTKSEHEPGAWEKIKGFFNAGPEPYASEPLTGRREASTDQFRDREVTTPTLNNDDVHHSLTDLGVPEEQSRYFRRRFGSGTEGAVVTVTAPGREAEAEQILKQHGADVGTSMDTFEHKESETMAQGQDIQLYGEVLRVHTHRVGRGEVRLRKEVHTENQTVEVPVKREELVVERTPVQGEHAAGTPSFRNEEIRVPLSEERARVEKQPVVREQVHVGKKEVQNTEKVDEQVRSEDLKVEENVRPGKKSAA